MIANGLVRGHCPRWASRRHLRRLHTVTGEAKSLVTGRPPARGHVVRPSSGGKSASREVTVSFPPVYRPIGHAAGTRLPPAESAATVRHMLLWINGPFGGGKTATAHELNRRLPGSVVCNPEHVGFGMRRMLPAALRGNFQDLPTWRHSVVELLRLTLAAWDGPVIVPMTLVNSGYFQEIIGSLRDDGVPVHHFTLLAEPATVRRRLGRRSLGFERKQGSWAANHLSEHLQRLRAPEFAQHIHTDQQAIAQVADAIASSAGLAITPSTDGPLRASLRRYATTIRHIRFD